MILKKSDLLPVFFIVCGNEDDLFNVLAECHSIFGL